MSDDNTPLVEGVEPGPGEAASPLESNAAPGLDSTPDGGFSGPDAPSGVAVPPAVLASPVAAAPRRRGIHPAVIAVIVVILLAAVGVGGFFGGRAYIQSTETNLVTEGEAAIQAEDWAAAEAASEKALALQPAAWLQHTHQATTQRGLARYHLGKFDLALEDFAASLAVNPDQMNLYQLRAEYYFDQKQYAETITDIEVLMNDKPGDAALYKWRSDCLLGQGETEKAIADMEKALTFDDTLVELHTPLMEYYFEKGDLETSAQHAEIVQQNDDAHGLPYTLKAIDHYGKLEYDPAFEAANAAIERENPPSVVYQLRGGVLTWRYQPEEALADLDKAIEMNPDDVEALALRAFLHLQAQQWDLAQADVESAAAADPEAAATLWAQAMWQLYKYYDEKQAQELINKAITLQDNRPEFYVVRAQTYSLTEQHKEALADFDKALELFPDFAPAVAGRAQLLFARYEANEDDAQKEAERIEAVWPNWYASDVLVALAYQREYLYVKAADTADKVIEEYPSISQGYLLRASLLLSQHKFDEAIPDLEKALELEPQSLAARYGLAMVYADKKEYDKALGYLKEAMDLDPNAAAPYVLRAQIYIQQSEYTKAGEDVKEALKLDPKNIDALLVSAQLKMHDDDLIQAINDCNMAIEVAPENPAPYLVRSQAYIQDEDLKHARDDASKALQLDSGSPMAFALLGQLDLLEENPSGAIYNARKAVNAAPWLAEANATLGRAYLADDDADQALTYLKKAIALDPTLVDVHYYLAQAYREKKLYEMAVESLRTLLDSDNADADLVNTAEDDLAFLETIPPLKDGVRTMVDEENGYTIGYDNTWEPQQIEKDDGEVVTALQLSKFSETIGFADVEVVIFKTDPANSWVTAQQWLKALTDSFFVDLNGYRSVSWGDYRTDHGTAATHTFKYSSELEDSNDTFEMMVIHYCFVTKGRFVIIEMRSPEFFFDDFLEDIKKIVDTFDFLPDSP